MKEFSRLIRTGRHSDGSHYAGINLILYQRWNGYSLKSTEILVSVYPCGFCLEFRDAAWVYEDSMSNDERFSMIYDDGEENEAADVWWESVELEKCCAGSSKTNKRSSI